MTNEQSANRYNDGLKVLNALLKENQEYAANNCQDIGRRFEYDLKVMALTDAIEAFCEKHKRENSGCGCACGETDKDFCAICSKIRVEAIKEKLDRENPKPLPLPQLWERDGKPVWVDGLECVWGIVNCEKETIETNHFYYKFVDYETLCTAYDYPPKEEAK